MHERDGGAGEPRRVPIENREQDTSDRREAGVRSGPPGSGRGSIFFVQIAYLVALGVFVILYRVHTIEPRAHFFGPVPFLVPWFGAVGATMLSLSGVFDHRGRDWQPDYCYWHWARPLVGGVVSTISVLIFQSGILAVGGQLPSQASTDTAKNLLYYIVAFVVGYRENIFRQLIGRLADVVFTPPVDTRPPPVIEYVDPDKAQAGQNTPLVITGSGLTGITGVKLGSDEISYTAGSDTQVTATVPATAQPGTTTLTVTTKSGTASTPFTVTPG